MKNIVNALSGKRNQNVKVWHEDDLNINSRSLPSLPVEICRKLQEGKFQAYLVGGGVRDLLLGKTPKDYDIATDAKPIQIKKIFSRSRIIGKRFPIVHVGPYKNPIEVTTFRTTPSRFMSALKIKEKKKDDFFTTSLYKDQKRRDFTINSLYFDPINGEIIDINDSIHDLKERQIVSIGAPQKRILEDPIRMLRAIRFLAKLGFELEPELATVLQKNAHLLATENKGRLSLELEKLLVSSHSCRSLKALIEYGFLDYLIFNASECLKGASKAVIPVCDGLTYSTIDSLKLWERFSEYEEGRKRHSTSDPVLLFAALFWPSLVCEISALEGLGGAARLISKEIRKDQNDHRLKRTKVRNSEKPSLQLQSDSERALYLIGTQLLLAQNELGMLSHNMREAILTVWVLQKRLAEILAGQSSGGAENTQVYNSLTSGLSHNKHVLSAIRLARLRQKAGDNIPIDLESMIQQAYKARTNRPSRKGKHKIKGKARVSRRSKKEV